MSTGTLPIRRSALVIGSLVVAVLAVSGLLMWALFDSPSADVAAEEVVLLAQGNDSGGQDTASDALPASTALEVTYDVFLDRDPFESIRPPEPAAVDPDDGTDAATTPPGTTTPPATTAPGTTFDDDSPLDKTVPSDDGICRSGTEAVCNGQVLVLDDVMGGSLVRVTVGTTEYVVSIGDTFADGFRLLDVVGECADFLYLDGDQASTFILCEGGTVLK